MDKRNIIDMSAFLQDNRHPAIREVEGYWQALRAGRLVPRRSDATTGTSCEGAMLYLAW